MNIKEVNLSLQDLSALIAPNNYGKSNILSAIQFGISFINGLPEQKLSQMNYRPLIPINKSLELIPFLFEIEGSFTLDNKECSFIYGYSFEWAKTKDVKNGARIIKEYLKLKASDDLKYKSYICRGDSMIANYLASPTGRCSKQLLVQESVLALNKLNNFDELFYIKVIRTLNKIDIRHVNTLENPDKYFTMISPDEDINDFSIAFPKSGKIGFFINSLKKLSPNKYELLKNAVMDLLPNIEDFVPVQINLRKGKDTNEGKVPFRLPDVVYDIQVKETYNNQYTSISRISSGCKKILFVLSMALAANINNIPLITFEELENSVHPRLLQNLLTAVVALAGETKILVTSHSPYLVKYLNPNQTMLGLPNNKGLADFHFLKSNKISKVRHQASSEEISLGEYLFELMLDADENNELINEYFI